MDIVSVYDWFARDCMHAAEQTDDPRRREILLKLAQLWATAAQQSRDEAGWVSPPNEPEIDPKRPTGGRLPKVQP
jgi:hypothetical protein